MAAGSEGQHSDRMVAIAEESQVSHQDNARAGVVGTIDR